MRNLGINAVFLGAFFWLRHAFISAFPGLRHARLSVSFHAVCRLSLYGKRADAELAQRTFCPSDGLPAWPLSPPSSSGSATRVVAASLAAAAVTAAEEGVAAEVVAAAAMGRATRETPTASASRSSLSVTCPR